MPCTVKTSSPVVVVPPLSNRCEYTPFQVFPPSIVRIVRPKSVPKQMFGSTGETPKDMDNKLTELMTNMRTQFGIPKDGELPKVAADGTEQTDWGFNKWLGARFDPPRLLGTIFVSTLPAPPPMSAEQKKVLNPPTNGLDFRMNFTFEMPAAK